MSTPQINLIAGAGMDLERSRLELATLKLSLINMSFSSSMEATNFLSQIQQLAPPNEMGHASFETPLTHLKQTLDPNNPMADSNGYVYRFAIDPTHEMATLISATRAYEANVRAYNANSQMNKAAIDIGNR